MKLLIVLCASIAVALARPGYLAGGVAGLVAPSVVAAAPSPLVLAAPIDVAAKAIVAPAPAVVDAAPAVVAPAPIVIAAAAPPAVVAAAPVAYSAAVVAPLTITAQHHAQDELGQFAYGYSGGPSAKEEIHTADGITQGGYSYIDANGLVQSASYVSDPVNGFRVAATNLPVAPKAEDAIALGAPQQVDEEPLVAATRAAHEALKAELAAAAEAAPEVPEPVEDVVAVPAAVKIAAAPVVLTAAGVPLDVVAHLEAKKALLGL